MEGIAQPLKLWPTAEAGRVESDRNRREPSQIHRMKARETCHIICEGFTQAIEATSALDMSVDAVIMTPLSTLSTCQ